MSRWEEIFLIHFFQTDRGRRMGETSKQNKMEEGRVHDVGALNNYYVLLLC